MKKLLSVLFILSYIIYWHNGPATEYRYIKDFGEYTLNINEAKRFKTAGEADDFQIKFTKIYKDKWNGFNMMVWYIKEA